MLLIDSLNIGLIVLVVVNQTSAVSYNQPKFDRCASWNPNGITFANSSLVGFNPSAIFVDIMNTVYVTALNLRLIQVWVEESMSPTNSIVYDPHGIHSLFVTIDKDIYVDNGNNGQVDKCSTKTINCTIVMHVNQSCYGIFVDINNSVYCSIMNLHRVIKKSPNNDLDTSTMVAGNGTPGSASNMLHSPSGIFVDINFELYVADSVNHRIQLFQSGQLNGITVAGNGAPETIELNQPMGIVLDADDFLFILDCLNHRIIGSGPNGFRCLVGCFGAGSGSSQLNNPTTMSFDSYGNLFVADWNNNRIQKFLLATNSCVLSYNQPRFSPCVSWNPNAITFANNITVGRSYGVFVDANDSIYVTNREKLIVLIWSQGSLNPTRNLSDNLISPRSVFVTTNGDVYVANTGGGGRVDKWTINATNSVVAMMPTGDCFGLFVDIYNNLYCSVGTRHQIMKILLDTDINKTTIVAGNGSNGSASNLLYSPRGIFVDLNLDLYVADSSNHRIQLFRSGQLNGTTVAGNGTSGVFTLDNPHGVVLDGNGYLFIVDYGHHRIIASGPGGFRCLVGCSSKPGSTAYELNYPQTMAFDSYGNIFVTDRDNGRIQKFPVTINSCVQSLFPSFVASTCIDSSRIGLTCNISNAVCNMFKPCQNNGTCFNNDTEPHKYVCLCPSGFNGTQCQFDHRPCKPNTCWHDGKCNETSNTTFFCQCQFGWHGIHCERMDNYCEDVKCQNNGACRPLFLNYSCECLGESFSGPHCEITSTKIQMYQIVSKSFGYVGIIALISVAMFIVIMDILKYGFGIDPVEEERELIRRKKQAKKRKPVIQRFVYVNPSAPSPPEQPISTIEETAVS